MRNFRIPSRLSSPPKAATVLTAIVLVLLPVAAAVGLLIPGFYRDTAWMIPQARGQDLVTLIVAEPLLLGALIAARRGYAIAFPILIGMLGYVLYTYAMYSYTAYFNALFLVYVALLSASLFALIDLLVHLDTERLRASIRPALPARAIAVFLALIGVLFLLAWLGQIVPATLRGTIPDAVVQAKTPTSAVYVQDLGIIIPLLLLAGVWLWQRRAWGYALGMSLLVTADVMLIALFAMAIFMARADIPDALAMAWLFAILMVVSLGFTVLFIAHVGQPVAPAHIASPRASATGVAGAAQTERDSHIQSTRDEVSVLKR